MEKKEKSYRFKTPRDLTNIATVVFYVYVFVSIALIISSIFQHNLLLDLKHGASITNEAINANDSRQDMISGWSVIIFGPFNIEVQH